MSDYTQHYNLIKPKKSENYDVEDTTCTNMDIIDAALHNMQEKIPGRSLSTNDFSDSYKKLLDEIKKYDSQNPPTKDINIEIAGLKANKADIEDLEEHTSDNNIHLSNEDRVILTKANKFKGYFDTDTALKTAFVTAEAGDYAIVNSTDTMWIYDIDKNEWKDSDQKGQVVSVNNMTGEVVIGVATKEKEGLMSATDKSNLGKLLKEIVIQRASITLNSTVNANTSYTLPTGIYYKVGNNSLEVFYCDTKLIKGVDYNEVGTAGTVSNTIQFLGSIGDLDMSDVEGFENFEETLEFVVRR